MKCQRDGCTREATCLAFPIADRPIRVSVGEEMIDYYKGDMGAKEFLCGYCCSDWVNETRCRVDFIPLKKKKKVEVLND